MENINKSKEQNTGGIQLLKFAPVDWILDIPVAVDGEINAEIAFQAGTGWLSIAPVKNSASYSEQQSQSDGGVVYDQQIGLTINRSSLDVQQAIDVLERRRLAFLVYDNNYQEGNVSPLLVGTIENWLTFSRSRKTGKLPTELNHYALSFRGKTFGPAVYYTFE